MIRWTHLAAAATFLTGLTTSVMAETGQPSPWQTTMQTPVTEPAMFLGALHNGVNIVMALIVAFVLLLLVIVMLRFNERSNPTPSKTTHHAGLEIAWTVIPALILVGIAIPSFRLLTMQIQLPKADIIVKATGHQWYWSYEYELDGGKTIKFDSYMLERKDAEKANQPALLAVDNELVLPAGKTVVVRVVGEDVIHNFAIPSFGVRMDAVPGRMNQTWFKTDREGMYYGQCSRLCGANHAYMPIAVRIVSPEKYAQWLVEAQKKFASNDVAPFTVAQR